MPTYFPRRLSARALSLVFNLGRSRDPLTSKYSPEFRADAVALYHSSPGGTYASAAKDLGVDHETHWAAFGVVIPIAMCSCWSILAVCRWWSTPSQD
ncbi:transposase [Streptomyces sp. GESEQ-4]|uniref:transposase n=1 Tax=Streptomyces sp. GESEQ-4 TaxID=2812655 RepID=UPI0035A91EAA